MSDAVVTYRKLVMPKDLNPANRMFGGEMMKIMDEAAAMYAMCQTKSSNIVTLKFNEISFLVPVLNGDFLVYEAHTTKVGTSSITVQLDVYKKDIKDETNIVKVCHSEVVFVNIDPETGKSTPHGLPKMG